MTRTADIALVASDPSWLAHRYDPEHDAVHLVRLDRDAHARAAFLTDEHLPKDAPRLVLGRSELLAATPPPAPLQFVFHSAYCGSTLITRLLDIPGIATGLKEPMLLQDIAGWRRRGAAPARLGAVMGDMLTLLARPFEAGEAVIVKPSNVLNSLAPLILGLRPESRALLLHAPLRTYLASIAKKGMWGRLWVRELMVGLLQDGVAQFGFDAEQLLAHTDLQVAAIGWLMQHRLFAAIAAKFGPARVRTLDSETLIGRTEEVIQAAGALFALPIDRAAAAERASGPTLRENSKTGVAYDAGIRSDSYRDAAETHRDEIDKVVTWAEAVAASAAVAPALPAALITARAARDHARSAVGR